MSRLETRVEKLERNHGLSGDGLELLERVERLEALDVSSLTDEELEARLAELYQIVHNKPTGGGK